ncbi:MAG: ABC transporter permease [Acholeplasmataceae bacterium]
MDLLFQLIQDTYISATVLLMVALGGLFAERSGVTNIALEGIMLIGGFAGIGVLHLIETPNANPQLLYLIAMAVGAIVGGAYAMIHAYASIQLKANQIISATALNLFAPAFAIFVARILQNGGSQIQFVTRFRILEVPILSDIPIIGPLLFERVFISFYLVIAFFFLAKYVMDKTKFGLRIRAMGENPQAADSLGVNIYKYRFIAVTISGTLAGMGGVVFVATTSTEYAATVAGFGFLAIALLIFGNWRPTFILIGALFFGFLRTLGSAYSVIPILSELGWSKEVYVMMPYVMTLVILAFFSKNSRAPKALGQVYDQGKR